MKFNNFDMRGVGEIFLIMKDRVLDYLRYLRFYGVYRIGRRTLVLLLPCLRGRPETYIFHLSFGEAIIIFTEY